jgi:hypothetical protein
MLRIEGYNVWCVGCPLLIFERYSNGGTAEDDDSDISFLAQLS